MARRIILIKKFFKVDDLQSKHFFVCKVSSIYHAERKTAVLEADWRGTGIRLARAFVSWHTAASL